jgi:hypothetical protein
MTGAIAQLARGNSHHSAMSTLAYRYIFHLAAPGAAVATPAIFGLIPESNFATLAARGAIKQTFYARLAGCF